MPLSIAGESHKGDSLHRKLPIKLNAKMTEKVPNLLGNFPNLNIFSWNRGI